MRFLLRITIFGTVLVGLFNQSFTQVLKEDLQQACNGTYNDMSNEFTLSGNQYDYCVTYIEGPQDSLVSLNISYNTGNNNYTILTVDDCTNTVDDYCTTLFDYSGVATDDIINLYSHSPTVRLTFQRGDEQDDVEIQISYIIYLVSNLSTTMTDKAGSILAGEKIYDAINYQYTWFIKTTGDDNFIYFYIKNITLDDANGDFVAIGTGSEVFADSPALMFMGQWTDYPSVHVSGPEAYVYVFMKAYSTKYAVDLYYNTSQYVVPTLTPPPTGPPLYILTATIECNKCEMNLTVMVTNLINTLEKYILAYCKNEHLGIQLTVTEVIEHKPCIVVAFYVDLLNGTCLGSNTFTEQAYKYMMGNYSSEIKTDFGQEIFSSCPHDNFVWILCIVVIVVLAMFTVIFVSCYVHDLKLTRYKPLESEDDTNSELPRQITSTKHDQIPNVYIPSYVPKLTRDSSYNISNTNHPSTIQSDENDVTMRRVATARSVSFNTELRMRSENLTVRLSTSSNVTIPGLGVSRDNLVKNLQELGHYDNPTFEDDEGVALRNRRSFAFPADINRILPTAPPPDPSSDTNQQLTNPKRKASTAIEHLSFSLPGPSTSSSSSHTSPKSSLTPRQSINSFQRRVSQIQPMHNIGLQHTPSWAQHRSSTALTIPLPPPPPPPLSSSASIKDSRVVRPLLNPNYNEDASSKASSNDIELSDVYDDVNRHYDIITHDDESDDPDKKYSAKKDELTTQF